jgi:predicted DNA-binding transcriptional regulator YafY
MAKTTGALSQKRLSRILQMHRLLRTGQAFSGEQLADACREIDEGVTPRTVAADLKFLRDELKAPLPERANKWSNYRYERTFSIFEGLDDTFAGTLGEVLALVRQLARNPQFAGLEDLLLRLEQRADALAHHESTSALHFEQTELKGREHLIVLYRHILEGRTLRLTYQPYDQPAETALVRPCLLKEFNGRWFLLAWQAGRDEPRTLPLDRIVSFSPADEALPERRFDAERYFADLVGVTPESAEAVIVRLRFSPRRGHYVATKKIHPSQRERRLEDGFWEMTLRVRPNRELEARLLEFGPDVEVLEPAELRENIRDCLRRALARYEPA